MVIANASGWPAVELDGQPDQLVVLRSRLPRLLPHRSARRLSLRNSETGTKRGRLRRVHDRLGGFSGGVGGYQRAKSSASWSLRMRMLTRPDFGHPHGATDLPV